jgi:hypothetical protein
VLLDENRLDDLRRMFVLFGRVKGQGLLQQAWGLYIRCVVLSAERTLNSAYYILYTAYCVLYTVCCILHTVYCILYTICCILHTAYSILPSAYCTLHTAYCSLHQLLSIFASLYSATCACVNKAVWFIHLFVLFALFFPFFPA